VYYILEFMRFSKH